MEMPPALETWDSGFPLSSRCRTCREFLRIQNVHASPCSAVSACAQGSAGRRSYTLLAGLRYVWSCVAKAQWSYHSKLSPNFVVALICLKLRAKL